MTKTALLVGGTAATGRAIIAELQAEGYAVTLYNRGRFNHTLPGTGVEFLVGDPHFDETIRADLGTRSWDVCIATYGRTRHLAAALAGRCGHFLAVSGTPVCRNDLGLPLLESDPPLGPGEGPVNIAGLIPAIRRSEETVLELGRSGAFCATIIRYPYVYGPYSLVPMEWHVIQRIRDGRRRWALSNGGLQIMGRCAAPNAAALIGAALARPEAAHGEIFHAGDERQFSLRQWIELIAAHLGHHFDFVDLPPSIAPLGLSGVPMAGEYLFTQSAAALASGALQHSATLPLKAARLLGYRERVTPLDWLRLTIEHWLAHPVTLAKGDGAPLGEADFDYPAEDALLAWWDGLSAPRFGRPIRRGHPYDHPAPPKG